MWFCVFFVRSINFFFSFFFFFNDTATTEIYTLSLHDALPTCPDWAVRDLVGHLGGVHRWAASFVERSEEHTSELQSRFDVVCRLLLEKKNRFAVARLAVVFLVPDRFAVLFFAWLRLAADFLPPALLAVERLAVDFFLVHVFFLTIRLPPRSTLFPYTTLFRSLHSPRRISSWRASKPKRSGSISRPWRSTSPRRNSICSDLLAASRSKGICWASCSMACLLYHCSCVSDMAASVMISSFDTPLLQW